MSQGDKARIRQLSVQYTANKKIAVNAAGRRPRGVSLEMLAQSSLVGADLDDPNCATFITELVGCQGDVVEFVQTLPDLRNRVLVFREQLQAAAQAGHLHAFGEANTTHLIDLFNTLANGLDVYSKCPFLAPEHAKKKSTNQGNEPSPLGLPCVFDELAAPEPFSPLVLAITPDCGPP
jgi:hypothetical protein